jgi:hypothetical protein
MSATTVDQLLAEVRRLRGPLLKRVDPSDPGLAGYDKVWDAFNRYLTETMNKRQTLNVPNFCKIGWRVEDQLGPKHGARLRPHFQLSDAFTRVYGLETKSHPATADYCLAKIEEFNFSKAAIKYSQSLTKENFFLGLRAIVQHIGDVTAQGTSVSLDFEVGKLISNDRDVHFAFDAELYRKEGLEVPESAVSSIDYKPSVTFGPPSKDALSLSVQGTGRPAVIGDIKASALGGFEAELALSPDIDNTSDYAASRRAQLLPAEQQPSVGANVLSGGTAQDVCRNLALERHKKVIEAEAAKAYQENSDWEEHLQLMISEDRRDAEWRRAVAVEHSNHLRSQMQQVVDRRLAGREEVIAQASLHDFPNFQESPTTDGFYTYMNDRRANLRKDLDQQVEAKKRVKEVQKEQNLQLEQYQVEATKRELDEINKHKALKKEAERAGLRDAWSTDAYLKSVRKAIQNHDPSGVVARKGDFSELVASPLSVADDWQGLSSLKSPSRVSSSCGGGASATPTPRSQVTPRGANRRVPLGAAGSLTLQKDKLTRAMMK